MPGGEVKAEMFETGTVITITGKPDSAAIGTCIHDIFCVAERKSDKEIATMVKDYGFEANLPKSEEIKKAWDALTNWLTSAYGPAQKQYHELPFKHKLTTGQLDCYEQALATEKKVIAKVLYYPVIGMIVRI